MVCSTTAGAADSKISNQPITLESNRNCPNRISKLRRSLVEFELCSFGLCELLIAHVLLWLGRVGCYESHPNGVAMHGLLEAAWSCHALTSMDNIFVHPDLQLGAVSKLPGRMSGDAA